MRFLTSLLLTLMLMSSGAFAQLDDDEYVSRYFGTQAILTTSERPYDMDVDSWWGSILPEDLMYNSSYLIGIVNAGRMASGDTVLLNPDDSLVEAGYEEEVPAGFRYTLSFKGLRPSEVEMLLSTLGGLDAVVPGASMEFQPMSSARFGFYAYDSQEAMTVSVGELSIEVTHDMLATELYERIRGMYRETYGRDVTLELYYSQGLAEFGDSLDLSLTVTLVDDEMDADNGQDS